MRIRFDVLKAPDVSRLGGQGAIISNMMQIKILIFLGDVNLFSFNADGLFFEELG